MAASSVRRRGASDVPSGTRSLRVGEASRQGRRSARFLHYIRRNPNFTDVDRVHEKAIAEARDEYLRFSCCSGFAAFRFSNFALHS